MIENITSVVTAVISGITTLITPASGNSGDVLAYSVVLALPVVGGIVAFARRLVKKAR